MVKGNRDRIVKCDGRFHELRSFLYGEAVPVVLGDAINVDSVALQDIWSLIEGDVDGFDFRDPYYDSRIDHLRKAPRRDYLSLVPLIESPLHLDDSLIRDYSNAMGNSEEVNSSLVMLNDQPRRFLSSNLGRDPRNVIFPDSGGQHLGGYVVSGNFGVGSVASGGVSGGGIRSDSPFLLEVYQSVASGPKRGEAELAALVGFWAQDNEMLVSQMQPCRNAHFPKGVKFGVGALHVAEVVAKEMGFEGVVVYAAREHPVFKEHPDDWGQFGRDFVCVYDGSAKKLGFDGGRHDHKGHHKSFKSHS